jgi:CubicO group peptidase (beta-lactamase class C family)
VLRNDPVGIYGPGKFSFGHSGWGGSCGFADPERRLSAAYVMNHQSPELIGDPRAVGLIEALYACL